MRDLPADDDGFDWSLRVARRSCLGLSGLLVFFWVALVAIRLTPGTPHEEPLLVAVLVAIALAVVTSASFVRERIARIGIGQYLAGERAFRRLRAVYATFATAAATAALIAQGPALCGFIASAFTRSLVPLAVGTVITTAAWAALWPRRRLWDRWTWQARLRRDDEEAAPAAGCGTVAG